MSDVLAPHEKASLSVLSAILAERDEVERESLRVLVASRGMDLGRDYARLRDRGFVEEVEIRPGFLRRLFGAKAKRLVRLTARGQALVAGAAVVPEVAAPIVGAEAEVPAPAGAVAPAPLPVVAEAVVAEAVVAEAAPVQVVPAGAVPQRPARRFTPADFTEAVGGAPVDEAPALPEGERLDGLAEVLGLLGFELMPAGRLLAAHRWADGMGDAEVTLEVLVVSVAHAARLDRTGTARLEAGAMLAVIEAVGTMLERLVQDGALPEVELAESLATMRAFVTGGDGSEAAIAGLLDDPLRGLAPPAICPEGVWVPADEGDD